jgi:hypothetical protein
MRFLRCPDSALTKCSIRSYMHYTQLLGLHLRYCQHWTTLNLVDVVRLLWALWAFKVPHSVWSTPSWRTAAACSPCSNPHTTTPLAPLSLANPCKSLHPSEQLPWADLPGEANHSILSTGTRKILAVTSARLLSWGGRAARARPFRARPPAAAAKRMQRAAPRAQSRMAPRQFWEFWSVLGVLGVLECSGSSATLQKSSASPQKSSASPEKVMQQSACTCN